MKNPLILSLLFIMLLAAKSRAQDAAFYEAQVHQEEARQSFSQIHDFELRMQDNARRLQVLKEKIAELNSPRPQGPVPTPMTQSLATPIPIPLAFIEKVSEARYQAVVKSDPAASAQF